LFVPAISRIKIVWVEASAANLQYVVNGINHDWMAGISSTYMGSYRRHDNANAAGGAEEEPDGDESTGEDSVHEYIIVYVSTYVYM
jgi:hypothetical protein